MRGYAVIIGGLVAVIAILATLSVFFQRTLETETAEQFNKQQLLLANAEASNIQTYISGIKEEMLSIARAMSQFQVRKEPDCRVLTDVVFKDNDNVKKRVEFLDRNGEIFFSRGNVHAEGPDEKKIISRAARLCPGDVLMEQNLKMISIVAPICHYDSLIGAAVLTLDIQDIAKTFLSSIKSGSRGYAWMMDEKGNLLYHPTQPNMVGRNLYKTDSSCFKCHKTFDTEKKIIEGRGDYFGRYVAPTGEDKVLAFSTVSAGNARWIVAVSAPYSEVTLSIKQSMRFYAWIIILIFVTTSGVATMLIILNRKREQAEGRAKHEKELEMMHAEKLASLERLTSGITSEIGNPLTSIFSFVQILTDMEEDEFKKETLETISFHMNRIDDILKQLSGFSKVPPLEIKPCKVNGLIEDSLTLLQYDKRVQNITIMRDLGLDIPVITTDGNQLSQVIVNIILNAVDAMPNGGTLTIRSRLKDNDVEIDFEDTGVGISKENLGNIFDPFYTTKEKGTGLGLAVSYSIIKKLNGSLTVESGPDKGSRFVITLPLNGAR
ncbi:MAG TPA: ATP-binding protein [Nitrospirota bacterium]|nr:ATP-binding protein [Nitrospirota bacterium]